MGYYSRMQSRKRSEATEQEQVMLWCSYVAIRHPELNLLYHVPNGGSRNEIEAANLKRQGVKAGVPDLALPVARNGYHGLYIEMKFGKNKASEKQKWWIEQLQEQGYKAVICYGAEEAIETLKAYIGVQ